MIRACCCTILALLAPPMLAQAVKTEPVQRGDFTPAVMATGTVEPMDLVEVGPLVSGTVIRIGPGTDYRDHVDSGAVLMQLDDAFFRVRLLGEKAHMNRLEAELNEAKHLRDAAVADAKELAESKVKIAEASLAEGEADLKEAQMSLDATCVRSPARGMVLSRSVELGQAVGPNPNGPPVFVIWPDGNKTHVLAAVNENDVAMLVPGQAVQFTCAGLPGKTFTGRLAKVRLAATRVREAVQYTAEIDVDNKDGVLLPYLTADVRIDIAPKHNVLTVPNAALEWVPQAELMASMRRQAAGIAAEDASRRHRVWLQDGKTARAIEVKIGQSDGHRTEITGGDLKETDQVITEGAL